MIVSVVCPPHAGFETNGESLSPDECGLPFPEVESAQLSVCHCPGYPEEMKFSSMAATSRSDEFSYPTHINFFFFLILALFKSGPQRPTRWTS